MIPIKARIGRISKLGQVIGAMNNKRGENKRFVVLQRKTKVEVFFRASNLVSLLSMMLVKAKNNGGIKTNKAVDKKFIHPPLVKTRVKIGGDVGADIICPIAPTAR